jgi:hypothetical protein
MRIRNRILLTLAVLFALHFLVQGYFDYRELVAELRADLLQQAPSASPWAQAKVSLLTSDMPPC